jgi:hypothetical protein
MRVIAPSMTDVPSGSREFHNVKIRRSCVYAVVRRTLMERCVRRADLLHHLLHALHLAPHHQIPVRLVTVVSTKKSVSHPVKRITGMAMSAVTVQPAAACVHHRPVRPLVLREALRVQEAHALPALSSSIPRAAVPVDRPLVLREALVLPALLLDLSSLILPPLPVPAVPPAPLAPQAVLKAPTPPVRVAPPAPLPPQLIPTDPLPAPLNPPSSSLTNAAAMNVSSVEIPTVQRRTNPASRHRSYHALSVWVHPIPRDPPVVNAPQNLPTDLLPALLKPPPSSLF